MYPLFILVPLFSVIILNLPFRNFLKKSAFWCALFLSLAQIALVLFSIFNSFHPALVYVTSFLKFDLSADIISNVMLLCIGIVVFVSLICAGSVFGKTEKMFNFINLLIIALAGMNGVVLVSDVFSLYVFIEIVAVVSFILICLDKDRYGLEAAFKYLILSGMASAFMLTSIALLLLISGDTGFTMINSALRNAPSSLVVSFAIGIFLCALFIKGGLMPFHGWVPDAYSASPAPVSILLAGIITKTVGIYALIRIVVSVIGFSDPLKQILLFVGAFSIVLSALAALGQKDFKRLLAYSSISQVGYIVLGLGCATPLAIYGAVFHLFNHAIFKSTLFINQAAVQERTATRDMDQMCGLAAKMPATGATSVISSLSAAGIPPLSGFWSKLIIVVALWVSGYYIYAGIGVLASVITLAYFLSLQRMVFFGNLKPEFANIKEASFGLVLPEIILSAITLIVGISFPFWFTQIKF